MPATEQYWRNIKTLHVVFGVAALAMLLTTVWMLASDHAREAKKLQKQFNVVEARTLEWRKTEQLTTAYAVQDKALQKKLALVRAEVPNKAVVNGFVAEAEKQDNGYDLAAVNRAYDELTAAARNSAAPAEATPTGDAEAAEDRRLADLAERRDTLLAAMQGVVDRAVFVENEAQRRLKFTKADLDVDMSKLAIEIDEGRPPQQIDETRQRVEAIRKKVDEELTPAYQQAKTHRLALLDYVTAVKAPEGEVRKEIDKLESDVKRTETAIVEKKPNFGKSLLEMPILDAFGGPLKPQQVWLPDLPWNNNFRNVARFDRCVTCHQGIDKTAPGSAVDPAYEHADNILVALETPKIEPGVDDNYRQDADGNLVEKSPNERLRSVYGMLLAPDGLFDANDVTVEAVFGDGAAIRAGLKAGDIISNIGGVKILDRATAENYLLKSVTWGKPLQLGIRRGVPHPFAAHPRLDLFVGSLSPHKLGEFGCTICHEGQGNGTAFKWASHTPNDPDQAAKWTRDWGWFNNHHWIYPMLPARFEEANCLKCHHEVTELKPSERFPDPPAPKLVAGFETIQDVGCFGCHEINGYDGPSKRRGPDLRVEPNYASAAEHVLADKALQGDDLKAELAEIVDLARQVAQHPDMKPARKLLAEKLAADGKAVVGASVAPDAKPATPILSAATRSMAGILGADDETPGKYRRVGPSLRYVASKNDLPFLYSWIKEPKSYRPSTKMPQFFGLYDHLKPAKRDPQTGEIVTDEHGHVEHDESTAGLLDAKRFEPIEIRAASQYLLKASQPFDYLEAPEGVEKADAERGKLLFQTRGCLACHSHRDFPGIEQAQGPNLSGLGAKLRAADGAKWLYTWLKQPTNYHARTVMPNLFLDPVLHEVKDAEGKVASSTTTDPAADIVAYLLGQKEIETGEPWAPEAVPTVVKKDLDELLSLYLSGAFTKSETAKIIEKGIPESQRSSVKGDELLLVSDGELKEEQKLVYLGKKTIGRLGCAGCHDVPGFEDSKPIGTGLADWGRKEPSKLAFEQIGAYLDEKGGHGHGAHTGAPDLDEGYFMDALGHHQREGFIWQKLREPRSYDFKKTENKSYIDRLRMPQFNLSDDQREQIMTFVLGLVAEPPPAKYVYRPDPRQEAVLAGQRVMDQFNCAGCHALKMQQWEIEYKPGSRPAPSIADEYAFLIPHYSPSEIAESKETDRRGMGHATLVGLPQPKQDEEETSVFFKLWQPSVIDGGTWLAGGADFEVDEKLNPPGDSVRRPQIGGILANYLHPVAFALEKKNNPNVKSSDVWGFVPPPLNHQGKKVQADWFHDFLLDPYPIRPAVILRMPKFNLTSAEAEAVVNHFAAKENADFPYEFDPRTRDEYLAEKSTQNPERLEDALGLITNENFCVKCHKIGDFTPKGSAAAMAPNLADVHRRFRPEFLRDWIANPARLLPYTGMPVNFPKNKPADQKLFAGTAEEQVQAIVDLLLNWDSLMKSRVEIAPMVKITAPPGGAPPGDAPPAATPPTTGSGDQ